MRTPVVLLHGFLGRAADWRSVRAGLPSGWDVRAPDLPGHGAATDLDAYTMDAAADLALAGLAAPADVVGYSMGGRLAIHLAVTRPEAVRRAVAVSGSPGLRTEAERAARRQVDADRAAAIQADVPAFVEQWYRAPLWASLPGDLRQRLTADRARHNRPAELAASLAGMGTGAQPSHWDALAGISAPVWAVAGALDPKFVGLARQMAQASASVEAVVLPDAGHFIPAERPAALAALLTDLLSDRWQKRPTTPPTAPPSPAPSSGSPSARSRT